MKGRSGFSWDALIAVADQKAAMEKAKLRRNPSSGGCRVVCLAGLGFCVARVCRVSTLSEYDLCHGRSAY